jgi:hypothetical protein
MIVSTIAAAIDTATATASAIVSFPSSRLGMPSRKLLLPATLGKRELPTERELGNQDRDIRDGEKLMSLLLPKIAI